MNESQVKAYIQKYKQANKNFALIKASGESMSSSLEPIVDNLVKLQGLGLTPILTHGYGNQLTSLLSQNGVESQFIDGNRVTDEATLGFIQEVLFEQNHEFSKLAKLKGLNFLIFWILI